MLGACIAERKNDTFVRIMISKAAFSAYSREFGTKIAK